MKELLFQGSELKITRVVSFCENGGVRKLDPTKNAITGYSSLVRQLRRQKKREEDNIKQWKGMDFLAQLGQL